MKKLSSLLACILFISVISACKKKENKKAAAQTLLQGTWELRDQRGGMIPRDPNRAPGNGTTLKFKDNKMERYFEGKLTSSDDFILTDSVVKINQTSSTHFIKTGSNSHFNRFIRLGDEKLIEFFGQIASDGGEMTYVKIEGE
jgi:hypothetical protein